MIESLRVHAGPRRRRHCPVSMALPPGLVGPFTLLQLPGRRPRACQVEQTPHGPRLHWLVRDLRACDFQDYEIAVRHRGPQRRLSWEAVGPGRQLARLRQTPVALHDAMAPHPGLKPLFAPNGQQAANVIAPLRLANASIAPPRDGSVFTTLTQRGQAVDEGGRRLGDLVLSTRVHATPADLHLVDLALTLSASVGPWSWSRTTSKALLRIEVMACPATAWTNAWGAVGDELSGEPAPWHAWRDTSFLAIFDHPGNPHGMSAGRLDLAHGLWLAPKIDESKHDVSALATGESLTWHWRIFLGAPDVPLQTVRSHHLNYALPPRVELVRT